MSNHAAHLADRLAKLSPTQRAEFNRRLAANRQAKPSVENTRPMATVLPPSGGMAPLTLAQRRLWFLDRMSPGHFAYNSPLPLRLTGPLDQQRLLRALNSLIARHAALRTTILLVDGNPMQHVVATMPLDLGITDLSHIPEIERQSALNTRVTQHAQTKFDLTQGPLIAVELVILGPTDHALLIVIHHIVSDGWSAGVLLRDLDKLYRGEDLPPLKLQYADIAHWERAGTGEEQARALDWWRMTLDGLPETELRTNHPRPPRPSYNGGAIPIQIPMVHARLAEALSRRLGTSAYVLFLATFFTLMQRYTGQNDLAVGSVSANRSRPEMEPLIGFFVNTLIMRQRVDDKNSFAELVREVRAATLAALDNGDIAFDRLVQELNPDRDPARNPFVQVAIAVQNAMPSQTPIGDATAHLLSADYHATRFDLELHLFPDGAAGWHGALIYATDLFEPESMELFASRFMHLFGDAVTRPDSPLADLAWIASDEKAELARWAHGQAATAYVSLPQRFLNQAVATPNAIAMIHGETRMTYRELAQRAAAIARGLSQTTPEQSVIGVMSPVTPDMITIVLGAWISGRIFLPLAPDLPAENLKQIIEDTQAAVIFKTSEHAWPDSINCRLAVIDSVQPVEPNNASYCSPVHFNLPDAEAIAYVIFTSGTTGRPKGVMVRHGGLANLAEALRDDLTSTINDRVLQFASPSFDAFIFELAWAFGAGATLVLPNDDHVTSRMVVSQRIRDHDVTHIVVPPSLLARLNPDEHPSLSTIVVAGEACPAGLDNWARRARLFNAYGPTETTVWSTLQEIEVGRAERSSLQLPTIGRPIRGHIVHILDHNKNPLPAGVTGEIAIGGCGVARGYLNRPDLTATRFVDLPVGDGHETARFYLTGDYGLWRTNGEIEFIGRRDRQVKVRAHRIELDSVEAALLQHPSVMEAAAVATNACLHTYITTSSPNATSEVLRRHLSAILPSYALPDTITILNAMPRNRSGKLDHQSLPAPTYQAGSDEPLSDVEKRISEVMANTLQLKHVGRSDNFFELGGHSMLLLELQAKLEAELQIAVPLPAIFANPSVHGIAQALNAGVAENLPDVLLPFRRDGADVPLFLTPPAIGTSLCYAHLANALPKSMPVYGLEASEHASGTLQQLARTYVDAIRTVQPAGPYHIAGWSLGGAIAFETACQLEASGAQVKLILIDAGLPWEMSRGQSWQASGAIALSIGIEMCRALPRSRGELQDMTAMAGSSETGLRGMIATLGQIKARWPCFRALSRAWRTYIPGTFHGSIALIRAETSRSRADHDPILETIRSHAHNSVDRRVINATHMTLLLRKYATQLAEEVKDCLNSTGARH